MDIKRKITEAQGLTPTEQQLGISALAMGEDIRGLSIKEFAARANGFGRKRAPFLQKARPRGL